MFFNKHKEEAREGSKKAPEIAQQDTSDASVTARYANGVTEREEIVRVPVDAASRRLSVLLLMMLATVLALIVAVFYVSSMFLEVERLKLLVEALSKMAAVIAIIMLVVWTGQRAIALLSVVVMAAVIMPPDLFRETQRFATGLIGIDTGFQPDDGDAIDQVAEDGDIEEQAQQLVGQIRSTDQTRSLRIEELLVLKYRAESDREAEILLARVLDESISTASSANIIRQSVREIYNAQLIENCRPNVETEIIRFGQAEELIGAYRDQCRLSEIGDAVGNRLAKEFDPARLQILRDSVQGASDEIEAPVRAETVERAPSRIVALDGRAPQAIALPAALNANVPAGDYDALFAFELAEPRYLRISLISSSDTAFEIYRLGEAGGLEFVDSDDDGGDGLDAELFANLEAGEYVLRARLSNRRDQGFGFSLAVCPLSDRMSVLGRYDDLMPAIEERGAGVCSVP